MRQADADAGGGSEPFTSSQHLACRHFSLEGRLQEKSSGPGLALLWYAILRHATRSGGKEENGDKEGDKENDDSDDKEEDKPDDKEEDDEDGPDPSWKASSNFVILTKHVITMR